jgi:dTDP-4-dehydrorhamnose 3,5-epimerase-like enzyme
MLPKIITGSCHEDKRGELKYNNNFNLANIKRMYLVENAAIEIKRGWQGHKIEQRWFSVISGKFQILLLKVDDWEMPSKNLKPFIFDVNSENLDVLHVPSGFITCIQAKEENAKLLVMSDYVLGEINDEFKFDLNYFGCIKK